MASLEHEEGLDKRHDELLDYVCSLCVKKGKKTEAEFYCGKCKQYYCLICEGFHQSFQADHEVAGKMEKSNWGIPVIDEEIVEKCSKHRGKEIELFCVDHQSLCCSVCISMNHRTCKNVQYIPEAAKDFSTGEELPRAIATMTELLEVKDARKKSKKKLMKSKSDFQSCSKDVGERALEKLKMLQENAEVEMEKLFTELDSDLQAEIQTCEEYLTDLQKMSQDPNTATFSDIQRFIHTKRMLTRSKEGTKQLKKMTSRVLKDHFSFKADSKLEEAIAVTETLGKFEAFVPGVQEKEAGNKTLNTQSSNEMLTKQIKNIPDIMQTRNVEIMICYNKEVEQKAEFPFRFLQQQNGILFLLGQSYGIYRTIKVMKSMIRAKRVISADFYHAIGCSMGRDDVAVVTIKDWAKQEKMIEFYKLTEDDTKHQRSKQFTLQNINYCLCVRFRAKNLYIMTHSEIVIYNGLKFRGDKFIAFDSNVSKRISLDAYLCVGDVEVSEDGSLLYIADKYVGLITIDTTGKVMSCLSEDCLLGVSGMCVGRDGKLFVLNSRTCQVVQVDRHGTVVERVVTDGAHGLNMPKGIFYYTGEDHDSLFVTKSDDHGTIQVIDL